jgi:hypothetical protein
MGRRPAGRGEADGKQQVHALRRLVRSGSAEALGGLQRRH